MSWANLLGLVTIPHGVQHIGLFSYSACLSVTLQSLGFQGVSINYSCICLVKPQLTYMGDLSHYLVRVMSYASNTGQWALDYDFDIYRRGRDTLWDLLLALCNSMNLTVRSYQNSGVFVSQL